MKTVTIKIPDNCELVKDGEKYIVKEKKQIPPRTWREFCSMNRVKPGEVWIGSNSIISCYGKDDIRDRKQELDRNLCTSKEEAEAFLALMQLRQLRKAWVGDWEPKPNNNFYYIGWDLENADPFCACTDVISHTLNFPTMEMAEDFLECFEDLCRDAYLLL